MINSESIDTVMYNVASYCDGPFDVEGAMNKCFKAGWPEQI